MDLLVGIKKKNPLVPDNFWLLLSKSSLVKFCWLLDILLALVNFWLESNGPLLGAKNNLGLVQF